MFKLPNQRLTSPIKRRFSKDDSSIPGTPILRKDLEDGVLGEANMDGSIYLSNKLEPGSKMEKEVLEHEMQHAKDMKMGKLKYDDDSITYNGKKYPRKDGKIKYNGTWRQEGAKGFPWEKVANK
jgi:hypothetical protein